MKQITAPIGTALLLGLCCFLFLWGLGNLPFHTKGEPREALQVWEEVHKGEWILPLRNGTEIPSKPPLFHWMGGIASIAFGGVDEFSVRFPSALFATIAVLLVFWNASFRWGLAAGLFAGAITATSFEWIRSATHARVDMVLVACLVGAYVSLERTLHEERPSKRWLLVLYLSMGLAALAKGPVGFILPGLVTIAYLTIRRDLWHLLNLRLVTGGMLTLAIAGSWYVAAIATEGDAFVLKQIWQENLGRFFNASASGVGHAHPWHYLFPAFFGGFLPWSPFVIPLSVWLWHQRNKLEERHLLFPIVWSIVIFVFYSFSEGKRTVYLLPIYPALSLLLGAWWSDLVRRDSPMPEAVTLTLRVTAVLVGIVLLTVILTLAAGQFGIIPLLWIKSLLHPKDAANFLMVQNAMKSSSGMLFVWSLVLLPVVTVLFVSIRRRRWLPVFASLVGFVVSSVAVTNTIFRPAIAWDRTFKPLMTVVRGIVEPDDELSFYNTFDYGAVFYSHRHIPSIGEIPDKAPSGHNTYILMWESVWNGLPQETHANLELLQLSDGKGPKGKDRLVFAMRKPTQARNASTASGPGSEGLKVRPQQ